MAGIPYDPAAEEALEASCWELLHPNLDRVTAEQMLSNYARSSKDERGALRCYPQFPARGGRGGGGVCMGWRWREQMLVRMVGLAGLYLLRHSSKVHGAIVVSMYHKGGLFHYQFLPSPQGMHPRVLSFGFICLWQPTQPSLATLGQARLWTTRTRTAARSRSSSRTTSSSGRAWRPSWAPALAPPESIYSSSSQEKIRKERKHKHTILLTDHPLQPPLAALLPRSCCLACPTPPPTSFEPFWSGHGGMLLWAGRAAGMRL